MQFVPLRLIRVDFYDNGFLTDKHIRNVLDRITLIMCLIELELARSRQNEGWTFGMDALMDPMQTFAVNLNAFRL
jgi:hypothetical protein